MRELERKRNNSTIAASVPTAIGHPMMMAESIGRNALTRMISGTGKYTTPRPMAISSPTISTRWEIHNERGSRRYETVQEARVNPITIQKFQEKGRVMTTAKKPITLTAMIDARIDCPVDCRRSCRTAAYSVVGFLGRRKICHMVYPFPLRPCGGSDELHDTTIRREESADGAGLV